MADPLLSSPRSESHLLWCDGLWYEHRVHLPDGWILLVDGVYIQLQVHQALTRAHALGIRRQQPLGVAILAAL